MEYIKLIAIEVGDFSSTIVFEQNYGLNDDTYKTKKESLENSGYVCIATRVGSGLKI